MPPNYKKRIGQLQKLMKRGHVDGLLVTRPADWYYLTGFTGEAGALFVDRIGPTLVTDGRFTVQAKEELSGIPVVLQNNGLYRTCGELIGQRRLRNVGFD